MNEQFPTEIENTVSTLRLRYGQKNHYIYLSIVLLVITIFLALPLVYVDVSSQSQGIVRSKENNTKVISVVSGKVQKTFIMNNETIKKGDTLLVIDNSASMMHSGEQKRLRDEIGEQIRDLKKLCQGQTQNLQTSLYRQEWTEYTQKLSGLKAKARQKERDFKQIQEGYKDGIVSRKNYEQANDEMLEYQRNVKALYEQQTVSWQKALQQLIEQNHNLTGELHKTYKQNTDYIITSPTDGTLVCDNEIPIGTFIAAGQEIVTISPDNNLIVECYVSPSDIGFIKKGQEVALQYTAFNYNQWGLGHANVYDIDKNVSAKDNVPYFIVRCKMHERSLKLKNGYEAVIKKGMTLTGRFKITRRSLWQLLWDKVDDWLNPKQMNFEQ